MLALKNADTQSFEVSEINAGLGSFLKAIEPFRRLSEIDLERVVSGSHQVRHSKEEHVFSEGEQASSVWVLRTGRVEILKYLHDGKPRAIETIFPGQIYGSIYDRFEDGRTYPTTAVAYVDSVSLQIPISTFVYLTHRSLPFVTGLCTLYSRRISEMHNLTSMSGEPVAKRIGRALLDLCERSGKTLTITKREISELAGTSVETSIRTLSVFEKKRWISSSRGQIRLISMTEIKSFCA